MEDNFKIDIDGCGTKYIIGVKNEKTLFNESFNSNMGNIQVLITQQKKDKNGESYYNLYIIDEHFIQTPTNTLHEQIPVNKNNLKSFNKMFCEMRALEHYLWYKYGNPSPDKTLSFNIEVSE